MANMSYCRFHNTKLDMLDCVGAVKDAVEEGESMAQFVKKLSSQDEHDAFERLRDVCVEFIDVYDELKGTNNDDARQKLDREKGR